MLDDPYDPWYSSDEETRSVYENDNAEQEQGGSNTMKYLYTCRYKHYMYTILLFLILHTADLSLILNLTVDDHSQRLEKLEGALARREMLGKFHLGINPRMGCMTLVYVYLILLHCIT